MSSNSFNDVFVVKNNVKCTYLGSFLIVHSCVQYYKRAISYDRRGFIGLPTVGLLYKTGQRQILLMPYNRNFIGITTVGKVMIYDGRVFIKLVN